MNQQDLNIMKEQTNAIYDKFSDEIAYIAISDMYFDTVFNFLMTEIELFPFDFNISDIKIVLKNKLYFCYRDNKWIKTSFAKEYEQMILEQKRLEYEYNEYDEYNEE